MTLRTSALLGLFALVALAGLPPGAEAQSDARATDLVPGGPGQEALDTTRLHVDRLPPEAATVTRELYDQGLFLEAQLGALTFAGDAREVSHAGPRVAISLGYEFTRWFALLAQVESSLHQTNNRPPPSHTAYQLAGGVVGARFSVPIDARFAIWAAGLVGFVWSSGDVLRTLGFLDAFNVGLNYGGELGFDWHLRSRHHSLGLLGGARHFPSLARDTFTVGAYGAAYLRYVF